MSAFLGGGFVRSLISSQVWMLSRGIVSNYEDSMRINAKNTVKQTKSIKMQYFDTLKAIVHPKMCHVFNHPHIVSNL